MSTLWEKYKLATLKHSTKYLIYKPNLILMKDVVENVKKIIVPVALTAVGLVVMTGLGGF